MVGSFFATPGGFRKQFESQVDLLLYRVYTLVQSSINCTKSRYSTLSSKHTHGVWKSQKKSRSSELRLHFKMPKIVHTPFLRVFENLQLAVSFNVTKIGGKCQNSNATFWVIFKQCSMIIHEKSTLMDKNWLLAQCVKQKREFVKVPSLQLTFEASQGSNFRTSKSILRGSLFCEAPPEAITIWLWKSLKV